MINSAIRSMGKTPLLLAFAFAAVISWQGNEAYKTLAAKAAAQADVTDSVDRWKSSYLALSDAVTKWDRNYMREEDIQDQISLIDALSLKKYGFSFDVDAVTFGKIEPITNNGAAIGLTKVCLTTGMSAEGLEVHADSYGDLLRGLKSIAARPDIYIGNIKIKSVDPSAPGAVLGDFCLLLRKGNTK